MAFERLQRNASDFVGGLAQELFGRGTNGDVVAAHFDLRNAVHDDRHALDRVHFGRLHINGQDLQRQDIDLLKDRPDEGAAAREQPITDHPRRAIGAEDAMPAARDNQYFVGADLGVTTGVDQSENHHHRHNPRHHEYDHRRDSQFFF